MRLRSTLPLFLGLSSLGRLAGTPDIPTSHYLGGQVVDVVTDGAYAYLAIGRRVDIVRLQKLDTAVSGTLVASSDALPGYVTDLALGPDTVYASLGVGGVVGINIANPLRPVVDWTSAPGGGMRQVLVIPRGGLVAIGDSGKVYRWTAPRGVLPADPDGFHDLKVWISDVAIQDDYLFVAADRAGLGVLDLWRDMLPLVAWSENVLARHVAIGGSHLVVGAFEEEIDPNTGAVVGVRHGIEVYDVADPRALRNTGSLWPLHVYAMAVLEPAVLAVLSGTELFQVSLDANGVPARFSLGRVLPAPVVVGDMSVAGDTIYMAQMSRTFFDATSLTCSENGLLAFQLRDRPDGRAAVALQVWSTEAPGNVRSAVMAGTNLIVADRDCGLHWYDVTVPSRPRRVGVVPLASYARSLVMRDTTVVAALSDGAVAFWQLGAGSVEVRDDVSASALGSSDRWLVIGTYDGQLMAYSAPGGTWPPVNPRRSSVSRGRISGVALDGDAAYFVADAVVAAAALRRDADPELTLVVAIDPPAGARGRYVAQAVAHHDGRLYVAGSYQVDADTQEWEIRAYQIAASPPELILLGRISGVFVVPGSLEPWQLHVRDDKLWAVMHDGLLRTLTLDALGAPVGVSATMVGDTVALVLGDERAYIADGRGGVMLVALEAGKPPQLYMPLLLQ